MSETLSPPVLARINRPAGSADLGLGQLWSARVLPVLVAAVAFLAALALGGFVAAGALAQHWQYGAEATVTVQVPQPDAAAPPVLAADPSAPLPSAKRLDRALAILRGASGVASARVLSADELAALLRPWLGTAIAGMTLPMPAVIDVRLGEPAPDMSSLAAQLDAAAPGTLAESHGIWARRLMVLARSLQACTGVALALVALVAAFVVGVGTRAGLATRRSAIEIVHGLGATDAYIAGPFAWRAMTSAALGGALGALAALPVLLWLSVLAAPFIGLPSGDLADLLGNGMFSKLPASLWAALPALPLVAATIGWLTAQITVRRWLLRLP